MFNISANDKNWLNKCQKMVKDNGFCLVSDIITDKSSKLGIKSLERAYSQVVNLIGKERLDKSGEEGVVRAPMSFDDYFFTLLDNVKVQQISELLVSKTSILHLQNGFIFPTHNSDSNLSNFQYAFHPDFIRYMNGYVASINILATFTDIEESDNIFFVAPKTHHSDKNISQEYCHKNKISISAKAGSVLVFDSTLWHCGGANNSGKNWYGVNHQYTQSFFKQQVDYVRLLGDKIVLEQTPRVQQMLGFYTRVVTSLDEYYQPRDKRLYRAEQG
jgi:ectoine hydroxylase-related dioxygenase (phytanoyl-CoA dioxygenase family)